MVSKTPQGVNRIAVLWIILISYVMIVLDISIVLTGLPKIHADLGFSDTGLAWVQSAYTLTFGGFLLLGARAGDILGRRRMLILGLVIFTLASLSIGLSPSSEWMLVSRAIQGIGAAILAPSTLALLQTSFPEGQERTKAVAYYSAVAGVAASVGLVLGGVLADWLSWRVGFFINLPVGAAMIVAARRYIAETSLQRGKFDLVGALTSTAGMSVLVYGLIRSASAGFSDLLTLAALFFAVVLLVLFLLNEKYAEQPIMPLRLFVHRQRIGAFSARVLFLGAMVGFFFFTTQLFQSVLGYSPSLAGMAFLPATLVNFAVAMAVPQLSRRYGNARLLVAGLAAGVPGMAWLSRASPDVSYTVGIALPMMLIGAGQGLALAPLTAFGVTDVATEDAGAASGIVNVAHQTGNSLGLAVLVALGQIGSAELAGNELLMHRITTALSAGTVMLVFAMLLAVALILRSGKASATRAPILSTIKHENTGS